ncbi:nitroreductase [Kaistia hirudinis]|uniref:Putative NAD(P)H nitroreductase n=1 Tax=Kaistia hirudinis TaxID=1293440 RepID=A0A840ATZ4_9HYPH|nr:nitroreductase [Kaistia hirudinis]MBB3932703.1 nitroreductase [Kaistia hirudinis]
MTDTLTLLKTRRSIPSSNIVEPGPTDAQIEDLLTIASRVPDHGKLAPWRFILFRGEARAAAGEATAALFARKRPDADPKAIDFERTRFTRSPLVVAVVSRAAPHVKIPEWEQLMSAGAAAMNLVVAANAMGFVAQWLTEWVTYDEEARALLGLKPEERLVGLVYIGTPNTAPFERPRPALADIVTDWTPPAA